MFLYVPFFFEELPIPNSAIPLNNKRRYISQKKMDLKKQPSKKTNPFQARTFTFLLPGGSKWPFHPLIEGHQQPFQLVTFSPSQKVRLWGGSTRDQTSSPFSLEVTIFQSFSCGSRKLTIPKRSQRLARQVLFHNWHPDKKWVPGTVVYLVV